MTISPLQPFPSPMIDSLSDGTTGTGLDFAVRLVGSDPGLASRLTGQQIADGAAAADGMNQLIMSAMRATGAANDGVITTSDVYEMTQYIRARSLQTFTALHGDDENGIETGYHLVQGDGQSNELFGERAVDTIADGIYHAAFDIRWDRFANEDGNTNARLADVADWLTLLMRDDLDAGRLDSGRGPVSASEFASDLVYRATGPVVGNGATGFVDLGSRAIFRLAEGTISLTLTADAPSNGDYQALFSRDGASNAKGDLSVWMYNGGLYVQMQDGAGGGTWFNIEGVEIAAGQAYDLALSFGGETGLSIFLNGERVATDHDFGIGLDAVSRGPVSAVRPGAGRGPIRAWCRTCSTARSATSAFMTARWTCSKSMRWEMRRPWTRLRRAWRRWAVRCLRCMRGRG